MIDRKQAAELLNGANVGTNSRTPYFLEAIYCSADEGTRAILNANPDLRTKAHQVAESYIRAQQDRKDYQDLLQRIRETLDPDIKRKNEDYVGEAKDEG